MNSLKRSFTKIILCFGVYTAIFTAVHSIEGSQSFFTPPEAPFVLSNNEVIIRVPLPTGNVEAAQPIIDAARSNNPSAILLLQPAGNLDVGSNSLALGSDMCLQLSPSAGVIAGATCTAPCLIAITGGENISISSAGPGQARIDGMNKPITGIMVNSGKRINIDQLAIVRCGSAGIENKGASPETVNGAASVTRCRFVGNNDGLRVDQSGGFVCLDNDFLNQSGTAVSINSLNCTVAGNRFNGNRTAIRSGSDRGIVTRNDFGANGTAFEFTSNSLGNLVSENRGTGTNDLISVGGSGNQFFRNDLSGSVSLSADARKILLLGNEKLVTAESNPNLTVFNPPTYSNPHTNPVIIPGMGRFDLTIPGGLKVPPPKPKVTGGITAPAPPLDRAVPVIPTDLADVQSAFEKAAAEHPKDVVVLHLYGEYLSKSPRGLQLPPNSCVIIGDAQHPNGRILADHGIPVDPLWERAAPLTQVVLMAKSGLCSLSGGKLDGGRQAFYDINASSNAPGIALIEDVVMTDSARDGVYTKGRGSNGPLFIHRCSVLGNGGRGIWPHVATQVHCIGNNCSGTAMDGIDMDAHSWDCTALFNVCSGNRRHGLFLEEATHNNIAFGNTFSGNGGSGVHIWNEEVKGNTGTNCVVANICSDNRKGISAGGRDAEKTANGNLAFNNTCSGNRQEGITAGNSHGTNNFFSQCVVHPNHGKDIQDSGNPFFLNAVTPGESHP